MTALARRLEWKRLGFWAWLLRRVTGLGIVAYLLLHLVAIHQLVVGKTSFNELMALFSSPLFRLGELAVLVACVIHGLDGLRITLIDFFHLAHYERRLLWGLTAFGVLLIVAGGTPLVLYLLGTLWGRG